MANTIPVHLSEKHSRNGFKYRILILFLLGLIGYWVYYSLTPFPPQPLKMEEKSSGKNEKHANPDAQQSAEQKLEKAKEAYNNLLSKPNKTKEEIKALEKLKKAVKHWNKKKDWAGEHHSQKHKGN